MYSRISPFAFSTGDVIDTLEVSGILLNAENLEPMPGITDRSA